METKNFEKQLEQKLDQLTSHPLFLNSVAGLINFNSYRKILSRKAFELLWGHLQIPLKADQEKMMAALEEMQLRLQKMQMELQAKTALKLQVGSQPAAIHLQSLPRERSHSSKRKVSNLNS